MEIKQFVWDVVDSNSWLIIEGNSGILIDAVASQEMYREILSLSSLTIILTHSHFDHIYGLNKIREIKPDVKVIATCLCSEYLGNIYKNMSASANAFMFFYTGSNDVKVEPVICSAADIIFDDEYLFEWENHQVQLLAFHGHSPDSLIAIVDNELIFSGDSILSIPTVTRFPGGSTKRFWEEDVPVLMKMSNKSMVYPGHGIEGRLFG